MGRIIGIDVGQKRIGLAVTDPLGIFASGLDTVNVSEIFAYLREYAARENIDAFVVGAPRMMNNLPSESVKYTEPFVKKLERTFPDIPVKRIDERFTSVIAERSMRESGMRKMERRKKEIIDMVSAAIMLQSFLDQKKIEQ
jgi:putative holliday junction resolvase